MSHPTSPTGARRGSTLDAFVVKRARLDDGDERPATPAAIDAGQATPLSAVHFRPSKEMKQNIFGVWQPSILDDADTDAGPGSALNRKRAVLARRNHPTVEAFVEVHPNNQRRRRVVSPSAVGDSAGAENKPQPQQRMPALRQQQLPVQAKKPRAVPDLFKKVSFVSAAAPAAAGAGAAIITA